MSSEETTNLFERLSGGRLIDLTSRLTAAEVARLADIITKTCPECDGTGVAGAIGVIAPNGVLMIPVECEFCNGCGEAMYFSQS